MIRENNYFTLSSNMNSQFSLIPHYNIDMAQKTSFHLDNEMIEYQNSLFKKPVKWETSDPSIAGLEINESGCIIKPKKYGKARIIATDPDGSQNEFPIEIIPEVSTQSSYFVADFDEGLFREYWDSVGQEWGFSGMIKTISTSRRIDPSQADIVVILNEITFKSGCFEVNPESNGSTMNFFNNFDKLNNPQEITLYRVDDEVKTNISYQDSLRKWFITWDKKGRQIAVFVKLSKNMTYLCWRVIQDEKEGSIQ